MNLFSHNPTLEATIMLIVNFLIVIFSFTLVTVLQCLVLAATFCYTVWKWYYDYQDRKSKKKK